MKRNCVLILFMLFSCAALYAQAQAVSQPLLFSAPIYGKATSGMTSTKIAVEKPVDKKTDKKDRKFEIENDREEAKEPVDQTKPFAAMSEKDYYKMRLEQLKQKIYEQSVMSELETIEEAKQTEKKEKALEEEREKSKASYYDELDINKRKSDKPEYSYETIEKRVLDSIGVKSPLKVFGKDFFEEGKQPSAEGLSGAAPSSYRLGPGDELKIIVWSELGDETVYDVLVNPEGQVYVPLIGIIGVSGLSVGEFEQTIIGKLSGKFKHFKGQATLTKLRQIQIFVVGEVERPGAMTVSGLATAFTALYQAGGPNERGSMRKIKVSGSDGKSVVIDLYRYFLSGDRSQDVGLKNGDTIFVPPISARVNIAGSVRRPAAYEITKGTTLAKALIMAGNVEPSAFSGRIRVVRWTGSERRVAYDISLNDQAGLQRFVLESGDEITVDRAVEAVGNALSISGAVAVPGSYSYKEGIRVADLVKRAGGINEETANTEFGQIIRRGKSGKDEHLGFNLRLALSGDEQHNLELKPLDSVRVFEQSEVETDQRYIVIAGAVRQPGRYIFRDGMRLADLVVMAQGLEPNAAGEAEIARLKANSNDETEVLTANVCEALVRGNSNANVPLKPLDHISILSKGDALIEAETVYLRGKIKRPGPYAIQYKGEKLSNLIKRAGGLTSDAFADGAVFMRNVSSIGTKQQLEIAIETQLELSRNAKLDLKADLLRAGAKLENVNELTEGLTDDESITRALEGKVRIPISLAKVINGTAEEFEDVVLQNGDELTIPAIPCTVSVFGSVVKPTSHLYSKNRNASYYITRSGGYARYSDHKHTVVIRANGEVIPLRQVRKIEAGDMILVPPKARLVKPDKLKEWQSLASILGNLAISYDVIKDNN